jgi:uncharacterized DUF497 family protein
LPDTSFDWDPKKAAQNKKKHGVSFDEAATVLRSLHKYEPDPEHSTADEPRFVAIGHSDKGRTLVVIYCERADTKRVISARKATKSERKTYEENK